MTVAAAVIISMELSLISCVYFGVLSCSVTIYTELIDACIIMTLIVYNYGSINITLACLLI